MKVLLSAERLCEHCGKRGKCINRRHGELDGGAAVLVHGECKTILSKIFYRTCLTRCAVGSGVSISKTCGKVHQGFASLPYMGVVVSPKKIRITHDLSCQSSPGASSINADRYRFRNGSGGGRAKQGLRSITRRIMWLREKFGTDARIILSKIDATDAFRQVAIEWSGAPLFGYKPGEFVVVGPRLEFGWTAWLTRHKMCCGSSFRELISAHDFPNAGVTEQGRKATKHRIDAPLPREPRNTPPPLLRLSHSTSKRGYSSIVCSIYFQVFILMTGFWLRSCGQRIAV